MNRPLQSFSIRDVLWLTVVVALAVAWWVERSRSAAAPPAPTVEERYELLATGKDHDQLLLFDPRTGEIWERNSKARWQPHTMSRAESR